MEESPGFLVPAVATLVVLWVVLVIRTNVLHRRRHRLPPGPRGWPIIGSLPSLGALPFESLYELSKQYGPLMLMHLGSVRTLVVTSPQLAQAILKTHDQIMSSRPSMIAVDGLSFASGVAFSPHGARWRHLRKICTAGLLTSTRINQFREIREREVLSNLHFILEESEGGNAVNIADCLGALTTNNITQMMMKTSFSIRRSTSKSGIPIKFSPIQETFKAMFELVGEPNMADFILFLKPFDLQGFNKRMKDLRRRMNEFLDGVIEEHRQRQSTGTPEYSEDFVDELLGYGRTKEFEEQLSMDTVKAILMDMFAGAGDSSAVTMQWALTELIRHPHVMGRVQDEIDSVVGTNRLVQEEDLPELKYFHAVIKETFRLHSLTPLLLPRESTQDCEIGGFHIPAKTRILVNAWAIHRDPAQWERPLEFDPDRFLNSTIDLMGNGFNFLPFGSGRRMCPGYNLGLLMVLYPLAKMLHALNWTLPEGQKPEDLDISEFHGMFLYKRLPLIAFGKPRLEHHVIYPAQQAQN